MRWLHDVSHDVRFALRLMARAPGFSLAAVLMLGAGIGLAVGMLTVADTVLRRPLPVLHQDAVVSLWGEVPGSIRRLPLAYEHFELFQENRRTLAAVAGVLNPRGWPHAVRVDDRALTLNLAPVTGNFFEVLGVRAVLGRTLVPEDDVEGAPRVGVISQGLWERQFGGDPAVLGRRVILHDRDLAYTVVGVVPRGLEYPAGSELWIPIRPFTRLEVVPLGRLAPGMTPADAAAELQASFVHDAASSWRDLRGGALPLPDVIAGDVRPAIQALTAAAALLAVIACVNLVNLLLARTSGRAPEIAVRRALGAGDARLFRQLLVESGVLAIAGGVLGAVYAQAFLSGLVALAPPELPRLDEIRLARAPLSWVLGLTVGAALICGLFSAGVSVVRRRPPIAAARAATESRAARRLQDGLVVVQIGLAVVVLSAAGLLGRSWMHLERVDVGYDRAGIALVELSWPDAAFGTPGQVAALYDRLLPRIEAVPGVLSAATTHLLPFEGAGGGIDGRFVADAAFDAREQTAPTFSIEVVGPGYFATLGIPLLRGRAFTDADRADGMRVAVVSELVARQLWPGIDAIGRRVSMGRPREEGDWWTVVGIVSETRYRQIRDVTPTVYVPASQFIPVRRLVIRTAAAAAVVLPSVRAAVAEIDPRIIVAGAETMEALTARELARPRLSALLLGAFSLGAILLAGVGLYAVQAYVVRRRGRELAIRLALGASPFDLRRLVLKRAVLLVGAGLAVGLPASLAGGELISSLLFGIDPADGVTFAGVAVLLAAVAIGAGHVPARRAMEADPAAVLRQE